MHMWRVSVTFSLLLIASLADGKWQEYGRIIRLTMHGSLAGTIQWKNGPTQLRFLVTDGEMRITQDGRELTRCAIPPALVDRVRDAEITWGEGVFGKLAGQLTSKSVSRGTAR
jgi:hypothetical protein